MKSETKITIFPSVFGVFDYLKTLGWKGFYHTAPYFQVMQFSHIRHIACPMPMNPLYRGQNAEYIPCKPSLHRKKWNEIELFEREIILADFFSMLRDNPQIKDNLQERLYVNYLGLAQHYGIATSMIDMTNSPLVAAFFATTEYDNLTDSYRPILNYISRGIIYFSPVGDFLNMDNIKIWPIGQEALRRPGEQRAFAMDMHENEDFDSYVGIQKFLFWHNPNASLKIWKMTNGGLSLFPYDPMAEKVRIMKRYRIYSMEGLITAYENKKGIASSLENVKKLMENNGCIFVDKLPFAYTDDEISYIKKFFNR